MAKKWIAETELAIEKNELVTKNVNVPAIVKKYVKEIAPETKINDRAIVRISILIKIFDGFDLEMLNPDELLKWRRGRYKHLHPSSVNRYLSDLQTILKTAERLWKIVVPWKEFNEAKVQLRQMGLLRASRWRDRRVEGDEIERIKACIKSTMPMSDILDFAMITGLRSAEITRIRWDDLDEEKRIVLVRDRKHPTIKDGNDGWIPLLGDAFKIVKRQPRNSEFIFPYRSGSIETAFQRARKEAGVRTLRFHDLRHEAISRMFEKGYKIQEVAIVSGHKSWNSLKRYTNLKPESLHRD